MSSRLRSTLRTSSLLGLLLGLLLAGVAAPAHAAEELELSADGVQWGPTLPGPIFDLAQKLVPGQSHSAELWVRNGGQSAAVLSASVSGPSWQGLIADGTVRVSALTTAGEKPLLNNGTVLFPLLAGQAEHLTLTIAMIATAGNEAAQRSFPVGFELNLRQSMPGGTTDPGTTTGTGTTDTGSTTGSSAGSGPGNGSAPGAASQPGAYDPVLPTTGFPLGAILLGCLLAVMLIALGTGLQALSRKNRNLERAQ